MPEGDIIDISVGNKGANVLIKQDQVRKVFAIGQSDSIYKDLGVDLGSRFNWTEITSSVW